MYKGRKGSKESKNKFMLENLEQAHNQIIKHVERKRRRKKENELIDPLWYTQSLLSEEQYIPR